MSSAALKLLVAFALLSLAQVMSTANLPSSISEDQSGSLMADARGYELYRQTALHPPINDKRADQEDRKPFIRVLGLGRSEIERRIKYIQTLLDSVDSDLSYYPEIYSQLARSNNPPEHGPSPVTDPVWPWPIYRSGRTYLPSSAPTDDGAEPRQQQQQSTGPPVQVSEKNTEGTTKSSVLVRTSGGRPFSYAMRRSQPSPSNRVQASHRDVTGEEVAAHSPMQFGSSDYEWKRLEKPQSNRWNKLRGMWGKRSGQPTANRWYEDPVDELVHGGELRILQSPVRPM